MDESFQPARYISDLAEELVMEFARGARATTPGLVGGAREVPVRKKLESLLPPTVSVGSGCIIDSYGHTSRQIDVVIYEKNICPCFYVNDSIDAGYYPCEGVIAVGEVKSSTGRRELEDSFDKIASVKRLRRHAVLEAGLVGQSVASRSYGSLLSTIGTPDESFNQDEHVTHQIYGFLVTSAFSNSKDTVCKHVIELCARHGRLASLNILVALKQGVLSFINRPENKTCLLYVLFQIRGYLPLLRTRAKIARW